MGVTARDLSQQSLAAVRAKDRATWLSLFAPDALVEDPVGKSVLDPTGKGHKGPEAIAAFFDNVIAPQKRFDYEIRQSFLCADEVANVCHFDIVTGPDDREIKVDLVVVYRMNENGKIANLRAFWEAAKIPGMAL